MTTKTDEVENLSLNDDIQLSLKHSIWPEKISGKSVQVEIASIIPSLWSLDNNGVTTGIINNRTVLVVGTKIDYDRDYSINFFIIDIETHEILGTLNFENDKRRLTMRIIDIFIYNNSVFVVFDEFNDSMNLPVIYKFTYEPKSKTWDKTIASKNFQCYYTYRYTNTISGVCVLSMMRGMSYDRQCLIIYELESNELGSGIELRPEHNSNLIVNCAGRRIVIASESYFEILEQNEDGFFESTHGSENTRMTYYAFPKYQIIFAPDNQQIVRINNRLIRVIGLQGKKLRVDKIPHLDSACSAVFAPNNALLACALETRIKVLNWITKELVAEIKFIIPYCVPYRLIFSPCERYLIVEATSSSFAIIDMQNILTNTLLYSPNDMLFWE